MRNIWKFQKERIEQNNDSEHDPRPWQKNGGKDQEDARNV